MQELLSESLILPLESAGLSGGGSPGLAWVPKLGNRDEVATKESEALGRPDGEVLRAESGKEARAAERHPQINRLGERKMQ